jgi:ABC-type branched-subunit amino acid transport system ATPase component
MLGLRRTFQRQQVFGGLSVEDNVLCACEWGSGSAAADLLALPGRRRREAQRRAAIMDYLEACGLQALRRVPASALPIGQARMLELARAVAGEPTVLLRTSRPPASVRPRPDGSSRSLRSSGRPANAPSSLSNTTSPS